MERLSSYQGLQLLARMGQWYPLHKLPLAGGRLITQHLEGVLVAVAMGQRAVATERLGFHHGSYRKLYEVLPDLL